MSYEYKLKSQNTPRLHWNSSREIKFTINVYYFQLHTVKPTQYQIAYYHNPFNVTKILYLANAYTYSKICIGPSYCHSASLPIIKYCL